MTLYTRATTGRAHDWFVPVRHGPRRVAKRGATAPTPSRRAPTPSRHAVAASARRDTWGGVPGGTGVASRVTPGVTTGLRGYNYGID